MNLGKDNVSFFCFKAFDLSASSEPSGLNDSRSSDSSFILGRYETGDRGALHQIYSDLMEDWLLQCHNFGK